MLVARYMRTSSPSITLSIVDQKLKLGGYEVEYLEDFIHQESVSNFPGDRHVDIITPSSGFSKPKEMFITYRNKA